MKDDRSYNKYGQAAIQAVDMILHNPKMCPVETWERATSFKHTETN